MFITLLVVTFFLALVVSLVAVTFFDSPIRKILTRIIADEISLAWAKYLRFAVIVVGVSSGVRIWQLEKYIAPLQNKEGQALVLTRERWVLELYRTVIDSLQGIAWLLLVFFVFALIAYVIVRIFEVRKPKSEPASDR